jgi:hypothetical protein
MLEEDCFWQRPWRRTGISHGTHNHQQKAPEAFGHNFLS